TVTIITFTVTFYISVSHFFFYCFLPPPISTLFPYTTLFRSGSPWGKEAWPMAIDAYGLRDEVERRVRNGETFSLQEIRRIMKQTGLSYVQVVSRAKALKKQMDQAEQEAEANGTVFDKEQYLHERMGGK